MVSRRRCLRWLKVCLVIIVLVPLFYLGALVMTQAAYTAGWLTLPVIDSPIGAVIEVLWAPASWYLKNHDDDLISSVLKLAFDSGDKLGDFLRR